MRPAFLWTLPILLARVVGASYAEFYGASSATASLGGQADLGSGAAANNYYAPSLLAGAANISGDLTLGVVSPRFRDIRGIVTKNSSNSDTTGRGDVSGHYPSSRHVALHLLLPLRPGRDSLGFSLFSPLGSVLKADSGDAHLPEYVLYRARHKRPALHLNYARSLGGGLSFSLGTHLGLQSTTKAHTQVSLAQAPYGSSSRSDATVSPSLGGILGLSKTTEGGHHYYMAYQQEMKSHVSAHVSGEINDPTGLLFDITLESLVYYDPHILRVGHMKRWGIWTSFLSLEHQLWRNYRPPVLTIRRNSGVILPSEDMGAVEGRKSPSPSWALNTPSRSDCP